jgi:hypothetical protein
MECDGGSRSLNSSVWSITVSGGVVEHLAEVVLEGRSKWALDRRPFDAHGA